MHEEVTTPMLDYPKELVSEIPVESKPNYDQRIAFIQQALRMSQKEHYLALDEMSQHDLTRLLLPVD
jgi:hypothetical protein